MRKILKGIITSVFALSLILPTTVITANALPVSLSTPGEVEIAKGSALTTSGRVSADDLGKAIKSKSLNLLPGDTLEVSLGNLTIYGAMQLKEGLTTASDCIVPVGVKLILNAGTFVLNKNAADAYANPRAGSLTVSKSDVTINGSTIVARDVVAATNTNFAGIAIDSSTASKINNIQVNGVTIECATSLGFPNNDLTGMNYADGIVTFGMIGDLTVNNCTINGYNSRCPLYFNSDGGSIDKLTLTNSTINGKYIYSPYFTKSITNVNINGNKFYGNYSDPLKNKIAGLFSDASSATFSVTNNYFDNCAYALGILSNVTSRSGLTFTGNSFSYGGPVDSVVGIREFNTFSPNISPVDQATHKYSTSNVALDNSYAQDYWFSKVTSSTTPTTPVYPYIPYYPTTTTTPATKVDDPFVYVYKDTPIGTTTTTTTPTTTDTTSRRDRTTRSSRNANAVINASNKTLVAGSSFNFKEGVTATDNGGNGASLTNKVTITGSINTLKPGTYPITYKVTGANGVAVSKVVTVTVKAK